MKRVSQGKLFDLPINQKAAEFIAEETILGELGSIPNIGDWRESDDRFIFEIEASYPRVLLDDVTGEPRKTRFLEIGKIGEITIDKQKGRVLDRPRYYDVSRAIHEKMDFISDTIEKALVKVAADEFSLLPFPIHLHTPVIDVISWLLINDRLSLSDIGRLSDVSAQKLLSTIEPLQSVQLIETKNDIIVPGPVLIGIEEKYSKPSEQLSKSLAYFFRSGYSFIESIRQVLGPHLRLANIIYERSLEVEEIVPISVGQITRDFVEFYMTREKEIKLPRYLVQLESIDLVEMVVKSGITMWQGKERVFNSLQDEELIEPLATLMT